MQECYYKINKTVHGYSLIEVVSDTDSLGRKLNGMHFKKIFDHVGQKNSFVSRVESELNRFDEPNEHTLSVIYNNCKASDADYGRVY